MKKKMKKMKIAIINLGYRIYQDDKTIFSLETKYLREYLIKTYGHDVYYVSYKTKKEADLDHYLDFKNVKLNEFDEIYMSLSQPNFFGGDIKHHTVSLIKQICKYDKKIYCFLTDPQIPLFNFAEKIYSQQDAGNLKFKDDLRIEEEEVEQFKNRNYFMLSVGKDYEKFINKCRNRKYYIHINNYEYIDFYKFVYLEHSKNFENKEQEKIYDIIYYGNNRNNYRTKRVAHFLDNLKFSKYIALFKNNFENTTFVNKIDNKILRNEINKCFLCLVTGDKEHNNNVKTARYYEAMTSHALAVIDIEYDTNKEYLKDEELKKYCYVSSSKDIDDLLKILKNDPELYRRLVTKQREEVK